MMKKITLLLLLLLTVSFGYSQILETFDPAPAEGVWISNPGEPMTTVDVIDATVDFATYGKVGRMISDAAGLPWQNAVLTMTAFSIDVTTTKTITANVYYNGGSPINILGKLTEGIDQPDKEIGMDHPGTGWSLLTWDFTGIATGAYNKISFFINRAAGGAWEGGDGSTVSREVWIDNITAAGTAIVPDPEPTSVSPTQPARAAADVISLFSEEYTDIAVSEWSTSWDNSDIADVQILGDDMKKVNFGTFLGIQLGAEIDLAGFTHMHFDYWITDALTGGEVLNPKLSNHAGLPATAGETSAIIYTNPTTVSGEWVSFDIPLANFAIAGGGSSDRDKIYQILLDCSATLDLVYFDNIYFHKNTTLGIADYEIEGLMAYPNPSNSKWTISTKDQEIQAIEVFNVIGKRVLSVNPNALSANVDASSLSPGVYIATITTQKGTSSRKLIKN